MPSKSWDSMDNSWDSILTICSRKRRFHVCWFDIAPDRWKGLKWFEALGLLGLHSLTLGMHTLFSASRRRPRVACRSCESPEDGAQWLLSSSQHVRWDYVTFCCSTLEFQLSLQNLHIGEANRALLELPTPKYLTVSTYTSQRAHVRPR